MFCESVFHHHVARFLAFWLLRGSAYIAHEFSRQLAALDRELGIWCFERYVNGQRLCFSVFQLLPFVLALFLTDTSSMSDSLAHL